MTILLMISLWYVSGLIGAFLFLGFNPFNKDYLSSYIGIELYLEGLIFCLVLALLGPITPIALSIIIYEEKKWKIKNGKQ